MSVTQGLINRILPFSSIDGPGNRMVIFLQGCNLDCINCHNPHTIGDCDFCGLCIQECPVDALNLGEDKEQISCDDEACIDCDHCLEVCPVNSTPHSSWLSVDEVVEEVRKVAPFVSGVTLSGGEATQQLNFIKELFARIKADPELASLTTFIDSNGTLSVEAWKSLLPVMDKAMIDLKALNSEVHQQITGVGNERVLNTISYLYQQNKLYEVRLLIIPEYNSDQLMVERTVKYLRKISTNLRIRLIPFRQHGVREEFNHLQPASSEIMEEIESIFLNYGFKNIYIT